MYIKGLIFQFVTIIHDVTVRYALAIPKDKMLQQRILSSEEHEQRSALLGRLAIHYFDKPLQFNITSYLIGSLQQKEVPHLTSSASTMHNNRWSYR